jgi:hypothetical protein
MRASADKLQKKIITNAEFYEESIWELIVINELGSLTLK